jgi:CheY-like chemotaxis protein
MINPEKITEVLIKEQQEVKQENQTKYLKVLIVEDDKPSELLIEFVIKKFCKVILIVRNGFDAVRTCLKNPDIDLVLMDILLPQMNGYDATRQIRQFNKDVVIIAQTAYAMTEDREKAIAAGCNDYISKPFSRAQLTEIIQKHFNK